MKDTTDKQPVPNAFAEWWGELEGMDKFAFSWLALIFVALVTIGIIFPIAGLIMLGIVVALTTIGVIAYIADEYIL